MRVDTRIFNGLHPIFRDAVDSGACQRFDCASPWRDDRYIYATDGKIIVRSLEINVPPGCLALIPARGDRWFGWRPKYPGNQFLIHGPHSSEPVQLPEVACPTVPCPECCGYGGVVASKRRPWRFEECGYCEGGLSFLSMEPVVLGQDADGKDYLVGSWLVALLRHYWATTFLPVDERGLCRQAALRFVIGPSVEGLAIPMTPG